MIGYWGLRYHRRVSERLKDSRANGVGGSDASSSIHSKGDILRISDDTPAPTELIAVRAKRQHRKQICILIFHTASSPIHPLLEAHACTPTAAKLLIDIAIISEETTPSSSKAQRSSKPNQLPAPFYLRHAAAATTLS